jgi:hypothetical protein
MPFLKRRNRQKLVPKTAFLNRRKRAVFVHATTAYTCVEPPHVTGRLHAPTYVASSPPVPVLLGYLSMISIDILYALEMTVVV